MQLTLGKKYKQPLEIKYKEFYGWSGQQMEKLCVFGFFQTFWILLTFPSVDANETISNILHSFHHWVYRFYFQGFFLLGGEGERGSPHNQSHQKFINLTTLYSITFLSVLHENKALQNFHKSGQHPIAGCMKGLENDLQRLIPP